MGAGSFRSGGGWRPHRASFPEGQLSFAQGIQKAKLLADGQSGQPATELPFAFENFLDDEGHGASLRHPITPSATIWLMAWMTS